MDDKTNIELFARATRDADIAVVVGMMGLFDGFSGNDERGSAAHMANLLRTPVVLVVDASAEEFIDVLIARHRPQSNGIAECFVRTLKEWLADTTWDSDQPLARLLAQFLAEYNDRPHQGLALPCLSPNEFAKRIGLL